LAWLDMRITTLMILRLAVLYTVCGIEMVPTKEGP